MSKENLERFILFLSENQESLAKVKSFGTNLDAFTAYGRELGYDFSLEEVKEYQNKTIGLIKSRMQKKIKQPKNTATQPGVQEFYAFVNLAETDENIAKQLTELDFSNSEELIAYGREKGYNFSAEDMNTFAREMMDSSEELSDEELELAAGGVTLSCVAAFALVAIASIGGGLAAAALASAVAVGVYLGVDALVGKK